MTNLLNLMEKHEARFLDLRFTDLRGKEHHMTLPKSKVDVQLSENGKYIDGSSIPGWQVIHESDLALIPIEDSAFLDPFTDIPTLNVCCNVIDPQTRKSYVRDPRAVALRAEQYIRDNGIADTAYFGQEMEFFIFDDVRWDIQMNGSFYKVNSLEADWNTGTVLEEGNLGHRPRIKGGYFPVPPVDSSHDLRSTMCEILETVGLVPEVHHHEVATSNQNEITTRYNSLLKKCDEMQIFKYIVHNVAHNYRKTVTFMPKPLLGDNGSGLHCHQSLAKKGMNLFVGDQYAGLSELALYYIGGIIKHANSLNALTNASTNSYKRLVPGFEAPVTMGYSANNRSAAVRIPHAITPEEKRIEVRFPDATANPYLAFPAMLMAGLDGIANKIHPGKALDVNLYALSSSELMTLPHLCTSLDQALDALEADHDYLLVGDVFSKEIIDAYIKLKREEVLRLNKTPHPVEFDMYFSA